MKPLLFNTTLFVLLFTSTLVAQTKTVYQKSFRTHPEEKFELQTINVPVTIETSTDENIHIDFRINFENYSEKEIQEIIDQIEFQSSSQNQFTRFQVFSKTKLSVEHYTLNSQEEMILELDDLKLKSKKRVSSDRKEEIILFRMEIFSCFALMYNLFIFIFSK